MAIDVETILTHAQLNTYCGGQIDGQAHLAPRDDPNTTGVRAWALGEVLAVLAARTPPIYEADLADPTELKRAVTHKAAERIYDLAITSGQDAEVWFAKMKLERDRARDALATTKPTVGGGVQATTLSIGVSRR